LNNVPSGAYAELPGVKLWFTDTGGTGVPIVLLHPNTGTVEIWQPQIAAFAAAGYRVIAFDRKGWGKSVAEPAAGAQPGSIAGDLDALSRHLKLDKFHLLGVAGGGFVALDDINQRRFAQETIDITGMTSPEHVRDAVLAIRDGKHLEGGVIRATLVGERARSLIIDPQALSTECSDGFAYLEFRDQSRVSHDLDAATQEFTSRGEMVRKLVDHKQGSRQEEQTVGRALQLALDAFDE